MAHAPMSHPPPLFYELPVTGPGGHFTVEGSPPFFEGRRAFLTCQQGFKLPKRSVSKVVLVDNRHVWEPARLDCRPVQCLDLPKPAHGSVSVKHSFFGGEATYACDPGFQAIGGDARRTCGADGAWSGKAVVCEIVECAGVRSPANGSVAVLNPFFGGTAKYTCDPGFAVIEGDATRTCGADGFWMGTAAVCGKVQCLDLPKPAHGSVSVQNPFVGGAATYACDPGFRAIGGDARRTCGADGAWSGSALVCGKVECPGLPTPANGSVWLTDRLFRGSVASLACDPGFRRVRGDPKRTCGADGRWSGSPDPVVCEKIRCLDLPKPAHGSVRVLDPFFRGAATYACDPGFRAIRGDARRTCEADGDWSGNALVCAKVECPDVQKPENGSLSLSNQLFVGSVARVSCDPGFKRVRGDARRTCGVDGAWSGSALVCAKVECPDVQKPLNGSLSLSNQLFVGSVASFACDPGFKALGGGDARRTCGVDGTWSGSALVCAKVECPDVQKPENGSLSLSNQLFVGSVASVSCDPGFKRVRGDARRTCGVDGAWSGSALVCAKVECPDVQKPENGSLSLTDGLFAGSVASFACDPGFKRIRGDARRTCGVDGTWSGNALVCAKVECPDVQKPENGSLSLSNQLFVGSVARFSCDPGFRRVGDAERRTCGEDGTWSRGAPVACERVQCPPLQVPENGRVALRNKLFAGSVATFSCGPGFKAIRGDRNKTCGVDGTWSGSGDPFVCEKVRCRALANPRNGSVSVDDPYFGGTATYACDPGFGVARGDPSRTCRADGSWSGDPVVCSRIQCPAFKKLENGSVSLTDGVFAGSVAAFSCDRGFEMMLGENSSRTCGADGKWSGDDSKIACEAVPLSVVVPPSPKPLVGTPQSLTHMSLKRPSATHPSEPPAKQPRASEPPAPQSDVGTISESLLKNNPLAFIWILVIVFLCVAILGYWIRKRKDARVVVTTMYY